MSEKKKNQTNRLGTTPFVLLWTLSYALGWLALMGGGTLVSNVYPNFFNMFPNFVYFIPLGLIPGLLSGFVQQHLLRWKFGLQIQRWWLWSSIGALLAAGGFYTILEYFSHVLTTLSNYLYPINELLVPAIVIGGLFTLYSSIQSWVLRQQVKRSWMWSVAAFVSAATFALPIANMSYSSQLWTVLTFGMGGLLQGAVMALTLVWLYGMTPAEPRKRGIESSKLAQAEENLAEKNILNQNIEDYLAAQSIGRRK